MSATEFQTAPAATTSARAAGFTMPSRLVEHACTWIAWPTEMPETWFGHEAEARAEWAEVIRTIARFEPVRVICRPGSAAEVRAAIDSGNVELVELPHDDAWIRDCGPIFLKNAEGEVALADLGFNAWGAKFPDFAEDDRLPGRIAARLGMERFATGLVGEGGGLTCDGDGTLITTETVMLNPNRNPGKTKAEVEEAICGALGVERVLWLPEGLAEDPHTDGHSDNVVQFIRPGVVLIQGCDDPANPNYAPLKRCRAALEGAVDAKGRTLELIEMPVLAYTREIDGHAACAPYANYYPVNGAIIAPRLGGAKDAIAFALLAELFPDREIVGVPTDWQAFGGGGIGCITQQQPA